MSGPRHLFLALRSGAGNSVRWASGGPIPPLRKKKQPPSDEGRADAAPTTAAAAAPDGGVRGENGGGKQQEKPRRRIPLREYVKSPSPADEEAAPSPSGGGGGKPAAAAAAAAAQAPVASEGRRDVAGTTARRRMVAVYGEQGVQEDVVDRLDAEVDKVREDIIMTDAKREEGSVVEVATGSGPKPVWSFADAGPKGWWPLGEATIGVPRDAYGRIAKRGTLKQSPAGIKKKGLSSTARTRELRDVWLTRMPMHKRLLVAIARRLSPQETDRLRGLLKVLIVLAILSWGSLVAKMYGGGLVLFFLCVFLKKGLRIHKQLRTMRGNTQMQARKKKGRKKNATTPRYEFYCATQFLNGDHNDHKLTKICSDIKSCMDLRGDDYMVWIQELRVWAPTRMCEGWGGLFSYLSLQRTRFFILSSPHTHARTPPHTSENGTNDAGSGKRGRDDLERADQEGLDSPARRGSVDDRRAIPHEIHPDARPQRSTPQRHYFHVLDKTKATPTPPPADL